MFRSIESANVPPDSDDRPLIKFEVDGKVVAVPEGMSVAAALLWLNYRAVRVSSVNQSKRGPYCLMGICFECLVEVDGMPTQRACQIPVRPGMVVVTGLGVDLLDSASGSIT